ncbi:GNAT family N-acetyltransferase [Clostridium sp. C2-6-12]|uniref:GNAT family N-acetyltransferase n=1 Tax=Clostridium sp. C2-6-12 TaxID=2698832 RepID=UPI0013709A13|nr:GNAT family N-acetyltransferase [Clostridium sp. C2-6-12]
MSRLKLILPTPKYKKEILEYKNEFLESGDSLDGTAGLKDIETFDEWYELLCSNSKGETLIDGFVPATLYMAFSKEDMRLIGMIHIRHYLNNYLLNYGGHIGYSIRKSERQKGYASEMLGLALEKCKELNLEKVLITCNKNNIASAKTMLKNGAHLENEIQKENDTIQRYWITLS